MSRTSTDYPADLAARSTSAQPVAGGDDSVEGDWGDDDLGDLLQELRVLLPGTQTLTAFLIILLHAVLTPPPLSVGVNPRLV